MSENGESGSIPKTTPPFIREFSKVNSKDDRLALAQELRAKRAEYFERKSSLTQKSSEVAINIEQTGEQKKAALENLGNTLEAINSLPSRWYDKVLNLYRIVKLNAQKGTESRVASELQKAEESLNEEESKIEKELKIPGKDLELGEARRMLAGFYERQTKLWQEAPIDPKDLEYLHESYLSKLNLDQYITLLKKFPSRFLTHVTRQGIRDHISHHAVHHGDFIDGFVDILKAGKLDSVVSQIFRNGLKDEAVAEFLGLERYKKYEEESLKRQYADEQMMGVYIRNMGTEPAMQFVKKKVRDETLSSVIQNPNSPRIFRDKSSIHFAFDWVADCYYGGESGNEIFFALPAVYAASELGLTSGISREKETYENFSRVEADGWNDVWVNGVKNGININTAIVFIPANTQVDRNTGSQYELDENLKPVENSELINEVVKLMRRPDIVDYAKKSLLAHTADYEKVSDLEELTGLKSDLLYIVARNLSTVRFLDELESRDPSIDPGGGKQNYINNGGAYNEVRKMLSQGGYNFKLSSDTISSKDYWEDFFAKNPNLKPTKIVYYRGSPERALDEFYKNNGLGTGDAGKFSNVEKGKLNDQEINDDYKRFMDIAKGVIERYFADN
ncbi:MAG: Uncharacterized protein G01um10145_525 [Microgenomates group bacterium Gr01-1014_5]|nr:MAG: Uncharacterized protein G01um10145_525 [Microgenomates group bacterium Gr01-1014_5]